MGLHRDASPMQLTGHRCVYTGDIPSHRGRLPAPRGGRPRRGGSADMFGFFDPTFLLLIPALIFAFWAQMKVQSTYRKYSQVPAANGLTGREMAATIMQRNGVTDVGIEEVPGT